MISLGTCDSIMDTELHVCKTEIVLLEKKLNDIIIPTVKVNGDSTICGELTIKNKELNKKLDQLIIQH